MQGLVEELSGLLRERSKMLVTAESCTGGLVAAAITELAGSSTVFERGYVTYSNEAKRESLGVTAETLDQFGAVSNETAKEMAQGALKNSHADIALSITGIAGPGGGSLEKPVGTVSFGWCLKGQEPASETQLFKGSRAEIRDAAVKHALTLAIEALKDHS
ncbi:MAG: CinA family protein [Alphaproteobacteria bacterium]|nr:CinA family protein [Alphaproteobacteria bacterium]